MSVQLKTLTDQFFDPIDIMAPDYDKESIWLEDESGDNRLDFSRSQLRELRDFLDEIL